MRRLILYGLGLATAAGAEYLYVHILYVYVASYGSLADGHPSGWDMLFFFYLAGASGAVGGLLGLMLTARLESRSSRGLFLAQGIIAMLAPFAVLSLVSELLAFDIAVWALAGAIGALLSFGFYIAGRAVVRWGTGSHRGDPSRLGRQLNGSAMKDSATVVGHRPYRVIYHVGDTLNLRTKALHGRASLTQDALTVTGPSPVELPVRELRGAELFRLHGLGRCIRISHDRGTLYVSVVRFVLFGGYFATINFLRTGELAHRLRAAIAGGR